MSFSCKQFPPLQSRLLRFMIVSIWCLTVMIALRQESSQINVILQYKLLATILSAVCSVIQHSQYVLHVYYTLYDEKYNCKITTHQTIFQLQYFVLLNNHQYNCNITKYFLSVSKHASFCDASDYAISYLYFVLDYHTDTYTNCTRNWKLVSPVEHCIEYCMHRLSVQVNTLTPRQDSVTEYLLWNSIVDYSTLSGC